MFYENQSRNLTKRVSAWASFTKSEWRQLKWIKLNVLGKKDSPQEERKKFTAQHWPLVVFQQIQEPGLVIVSWMQQYRTKIEQFLYSIINFQLFNCLRLTQETSTLSLQILIIFCFPHLETLDTALPWHLLAWFHLHESIYYLVMVLMHTPSHKKVNRCELIKFMLSTC